MALASPWTPSSQLWMDPSLAQRNFELRLLNWTGMRILVLTLTMINVHSLPPGFYTYFLATASFTDSYFFLTPVPPIFLIIHQWISFPFIICKTYFAFPMVALNNVDPVFIFLSPLCLSANTGFAAKIPPQISFPKTVAEREDLKQTLQFLSLLCDETRPRTLFSFSHWNYAVLHNIFTRSSFQLCLP